MAFNIARRHGFAAYIKYRGAEFFSKTPILSPVKQQTMDIAVEGLGDDADKRVIEQMFEVNFTPAGEWENLAVLFPHRTRALGAALHDIVQLGSLNTTSDEWTATAHGRTTGDAVRFARIGTGAAYPTLSSGSISESTTYFVRAVDANTLKFYASAANAAADTSALNFTGAPTGTIRLQVIYPLEIHPFDGSDAFRYENVIVTQMPGIKASAAATLLKEMKLQAYPLPGADWGTANSIYTEGVTNVAAADFEPENIKTLPYAVAWGATYPWSAIATKEGFDIDFPMKTSPISTDTDGELSKRLDSLSVTAKGTPIGITLGDLLSKTKTQGSGAARGRSTAGDSPDDLNISSGSDVYIRLYNAGLLPDEVRYSSKDDLIGAQTWFAARRFTSNVADPLFYVGTEAPA